VNKRRCPACGSTNPADATACCVCGFVFAAGGGETPAPSRSNPHPEPVGEQHSAPLDFPRRAVPSQTQAVMPSAKPRPSRAGAQRRGAASLAALLALVAISAIGLLALTVFRSIAADQMTPQSPRPTFTVASRLMDAPSVEPLPEPTLTESPLPLPTPTEAASPPPAATALPAPSPLPTFTSSFVPTEAPVFLPMPTETALPAPTETPVKATNYTVQQGDTCWAIATRFEISIEQLVAQNQLSPACVIRPGQVLTIRR